MNQKHWEQLLAVVAGQALNPVPVGFIIDCPWLPGWAGLTTMDYFASEEAWFEANLRACRRFPDTMFLPGFWAEYGMCTEPSAFGAKCIWWENEMPAAAKRVASAEALAQLEKPDPRTDGLGPFVLKRLERLRPKIEEQGHRIRFATARGPLNIASFLMGNTELMLAMLLQPDAIQTALETITEYLVEWLRLQAARIPTIDGIFILDDIVGFCNEELYVKFAHPALKRVFSAMDVSVRFFHNDARGDVCAPHLADLGVNLFNFSFSHSLSQMRELTGDRVALLGNIPPRDVMAAGAPEDVRRAVGEALDSLPDRRGLILSCGGGLPPGVPTENIEAFYAAAATSGSRGAR